MRDAGINLCRIGEFAWSRLEPRQNEFTLDWLHQTLDILAEHGIDVMMCTPTPTPPAWLTRAYPDTVMANARGQRAHHGARRHYCPSSRTYREHTRRIVTKLVTDLKSHRNIVAWQLDNEFGPEYGWCHCDNCQEGFRAWLKARYETLDRLNEAWKTGFWSTDYTDWAQIRLAEDDYLPIYPSRRMDSRRFWSDTINAYAAYQYDLVRSIDPDITITTNGMGPIYTFFDYFKLFDKMDVACDDLYFDYATQDCNALTMNVYRSFKPGKPFWIAETGSGALDHNRPPLPDQFRAWAYSSWAHGGDAHIVFRWRTCLSGQEQELQGILEHNGRPRHRYRTVQKTFNEIRQVRQQLGEMPLPKADVAFIVDFNTLWGYESARVGAEVGANQQMMTLHKQLYARNVLADFIPPTRDFQQYRLIILANLMMIDAAFAERLKAFVRGGGIVLAIGQIGMRDFNDNYLAETAPQHLHDLLGITIEGGMYLTSFVGPDEALARPVRHSRPVELPMSGAIGDAQIRGIARAWAADCDVQDATILLRFDTDTYAGQAALTEKPTGNGKAIYLATTHPDDALLGRLIEYALAAAQVPLGPAAPLYVEVVRRGAVSFCINHTAEPQQVQLDTPGRPVLGAVEENTVKLAPFGVAIVKHD
jgi:beta-galactosidase